ncbi:kinase-like domain-containing protein, partial [Mycena galopus ATCC 62051]
FWQQFCREAVVWKGLNHEFVLPFLGIDDETFPPALCMVSPWMKQGTVLKYLKDRGRGEIDRLTLEVVQGLEYLHSVNVVHGDLRGLNILISDGGHACLADFGLSIIVSDDLSSATLTSSNRGGSDYWLAPELFDPTAFGCTRYKKTRATDVYAFACVCLELHTGDPPFRKLPPTAAMHAVTRGERAERPATMSDKLWLLVSSSWASNFADRPTAAGIVQALGG